MFVVESHRGCIAANRAPIRIECLTSIAVDRNERTMGPVDGRTIPTPETRWVITVNNNSTILTPDIFGVFR